MAPTSSIATRMNDRSPSPLLLGSAQKSFGSSSTDFASLGIQAGTNVGAAEHSLVLRAYALGILDLESHGRCSLGPYVATPTLLGDEQRFGGFVGCEVDLSDTFALLAEWDAGA